MRMSKDGHSFRALAVKSAWTGRDLDDVLSSSGDLFLSEAENDAHQHFAPSNDLSKDRAPSVISSISKLPRFNLKKAAGRSKSVDVMNAGSVGVVRKLSNASSRTTVGQTTVPVPVVTLELGVQCDFCREDLVEDGDTMVLCCEECAIMIHPSCVDTADIAPCSARYSDARVQTAFLKLFVSLFRNYRQYLLPLADGHEDPNGDVQDNWFRFEDFMDSLDKESKPWYQMFFGTQAWAQFALERVERPESDIETLFFDEHITAKRNRSKLRISKEVTPFLTDDSYSIRSTLSCLPPNADHLPARVSGGLPTELDSSLLYVPREVKALVTPHELRLSKSAMGDSLIARARTRKDEKRKQEFGKWMKGKWREFSKAGGGEVVGLGFLPDDRRRYIFLRT
ncbi:hypothetical protein BC832DRAFT_102496 [Gaertneriomyces semiglobifer]|nr:hypothetical protein BC832DRAFT_102496 [Gaertneriomyces semiglobifer]